MSGNGSIRGDLEIKCPLCDNWQPMDYDYSVSVERDGESEQYRMSAKVNGRLNPHGCPATVNGPT